MPAPESSRTRGAARDLALAGLVLAYPVLVYFGLDRLGSRTIGGLLLVLVLVRVGTSLRRGAPREKAVLLAAFLPIGLVAAFASATGDPRLVLAVPTLVSLGMCAVFAASLASEESLVERFARLERGVPTLPPTAAVYCRRLTGLWAGFFCLNALVTGALALFATVGWWTLYCGLIAYVLVGLLMGCEYVYRCRRVKPIADREAAALGLLPPE